jgi:hypothetical protein
MQFSECSKVPTFLVVHALYCLVPAFHRALEADSAYRFLGLLYVVRQCMGSDR